MTAIAGLWRRGRVVDPHSLADDCLKMLRAQAIYGPDDMAECHHEQLAIGRCLMRTLPEDTYDLGPIEANGCLMAADVRLDNRDELLSLLSLPRTWAAQASDSAILFAAVRRWGEHAPQKLLGDYAFAFWDGSKRRLLLARDPLGERPLHFHRSNELFAFASMPKGLHALPEVPYAPDLNRLSHRAMQVRPHGPGCFYASIERIEPGHVASVTPGGMSVWRHWTPRRHQLKLRTHHDYAEALCEVLDQAVSSRLRGVGDVASELSGGLDSTSVTATAARLQARGQGRVVAFTSAPRVGYEARWPAGRFGDESRHAAAVAALYGNLDHVIIRPDGRSPLTDLDANIQLYDKPLLNSCNTLWMSQIYAGARERGIRVVLSGQLGNATISYDGRALLAETFASGKFGHWMRESLAITRQGWATWPRVLKETLAQLRRTEHNSPVDSWSYRVRWLQQIDRGNEYLGALGGWGIERRDPTADRRVVEFCLSVPTEIYLRDGVPAYLLRHAMRDRLPPVVLQERRKGVQFPDWHESLTAARGSLAALLDRLAACEPVAQRINIPRLRSALDNWPREGWERPEVSWLYRIVLLRTLSAGHFAQHILDQRR